MGVELQFRIAYVPEPDGLTLILYAIMAVWIWRSRMKAQPIMN